MAKILISSTCYDLKEIRDYIARDSLYYAKKFIESAFNSIERLSVFPKSGRIVPEIGNPNIREVAHGSYRIIYELKNNEVYVVAVVHGRRLLPDGLF